ncbi:MULTISPECIES: dipeptide/oligopeptide/nickel ABC transporter permease/ATP-binding protein [unclassified Rhodococcus (in: high G+C Gram-positive bacteria)]|jgi:peptide/nickel transport system permease protein|uniref:dipeptide/oligopeptide/nickel ABC transporter permease/ATP-binding protein n=1 Tax=unclassified Rhodococcus (in: high G+C Gram-positive bacteria) TaxID=192944 RepID=UPI0013569831|nr:MULTISPECIES: dipeptide/oligopeptide/nickel ABC transporter permease/ATP-binding protein [unclassified Rhodococcus (in: high G+C Gram-positive bacteria)]
MGQTREVVDVTDAIAAPPAERGSRGSSGPLAKAMRRFRKNNAAMLGLAWLIVIVACSIFAPLIAPHDPATQDSVPFLGPSSDHLLGTDELGRDVFSRLVYASQVALQAAFTIVGLALIIALALGLTAGYVGKKFDYSVMRAMDALSSFPPLVFAIAIAAMLGASLGSTTIAIAVIFVPGLTRLIRAQTLAVKEETFVEASRAIGTRTHTILMRRILPNLASPLIVQVTVLLGAALLAEASLSFVGLGVQPPDPSWGQMLRRAYDAIFAHPWQMLAPGIAIALTVLAWNVIGDGLRDSLGHQPVKAPRAIRRKAGLGVTSVKENRIATKQPSSSAVLSVRDLEIRFATESGAVTVVDGVSFDIEPGEIVGLVGESGCGKSMTSLGIMRLVPTPPGWIERGSVIFDGRDLTSMSAKELRAVRGKDISMIFQDPMSSLNPAFTIGNQLTETVRLHTDLTASAAKTRSVELLDMVGISDPHVRLDQYPHQLSGGMRQRVMIAQALACEPRLLIADEPTTALDVTIQAEVLDLLRSLQRELGMSMILVTHDLGVVADICDRVVVMYAGQVVEQAPVDELFRQPRHVYTQALMKAMPQLAGRGERLTAIPGTVPLPSAFPEGCRFAPRCPHSRVECDRPMQLTQPEPAHQVRCIRSDELLEVVSS